MPVNFPGWKACRWKCPKATNIYLEFRLQKCTPSRAGAGMSFVVPEAYTLLEPSHSLWILKENITMLENGTSINGDFWHLG
jgi:hypothetical protein